MTKSEIKNLDKKWREKIKERDSFCQVCGRTTNINAHHIVGRRNRSLRWDLNNGIGLCPNCHTFSSSFSAHQTPTLFAKWFEENYPERDAYITETARVIFVGTYEDVLEGLC